MSKSDDENKKVPEWNLFERLDELETITLQIMEKADKSEPTLNQILKIINEHLVLIRSTIIMNFFLWVKEVGPENVQEIKDMWLGFLKDRKRISSETYESIEKLMIRLCKITENNK